MSYPRYGYTPFAKTPGPGEDSDSDQNPTNSSQIVEDDEVIYVDSGDSDLEMEVHQEEVNEQSPMLEDELQVYESATRLEEEQLNKNADVIHTVSSLLDSLWLEKKKAEFKYRAKIYNLRKGYDGDWGDVETIIRGNLENNPLRGTKEINFIMGSIFYDPSSSSKTYVYDGSDREEPCDRKPGRRLAIIRGIKRFIAENVDGQKHSLEHIGPNVIKALEDFNTSLPESVYNDLLTRFRVNEDKKALAKLLLVSEDMIDLKESCCLKQVNQS